MNDTKNCRSCGAAFKKSKADRTVNCPACRAGAKVAVDAPSVFFRFGNGDVVRADSIEDATRIAKDRGAWPCSISKVR